MKKLLIVLLAISLAMCSSGNKNKKDDSERTKLDSVVQQINRPVQKPVFQCDYLGETPPDTIPVKFAPGVVSTGVDEGSFEINKQGDQMIFTREGKIMIMKKLDSEWTGPEVASFSGIELDGECCFSPSGDKIYFASRRSLPGAQAALNTWVSERTNETWSEAIPLKSPFYDQTSHAVSVASSGNVYCSGILVFKNANGEYSPAEAPGENLKGSHPFIAPDESYIIMNLPGQGRRDPDLNISYQTEDGWTDPTPLNSNINTTGLESNAFISPDGQYLFFIRKFDVYWVKASFIENRK